MLGGAIRNRTNRPPLERHHSGKPTHTPACIHYEVYVIGLRIRKVRCFYFFSRAFLLSVIESAGLYGRCLTSDPVRASCEDEKRLVQIFGRGGFSIMADSAFCHALAGEKKFWATNLCILYTNRSEIFC